MKPLLITSLALATLGVSAQDLQTALTSGKASLEIRTRYEHDLDGSANPEKSATALTNRTILGYQTGKFYGVSANLQFLDVSTLFDVDNFNYTGAPASKSVYATIKEPHQDRILQGYLEWKGLKLGRQIVSVDDQRFIGGGAWNQAPKSSTGLTYRGDLGVKGLDVYAGYISSIVLSDATNRNVNQNFARVRYTPIKALSIAAFYFAADDKTTPTKSYQDTGLQVNGGFKGLLYDFTYAKQHRYHESTATAIPSTSYRAGMVGYKFGDYTLKATREVVGQGLWTPDAGFHGLHGWSDRLGSASTTAPAYGLVDTYLTALAKVSDVKLEGQYHKFQAESRSMNYGKEFDLSAEYPVTKSFSLLAKYANYLGDQDAAALSGSVSKDLRKWWLQSTYKF
nr:hypothetical protein [uncultured Holophaga sp.]